MLTLAIFLLICLNSFYQLSMKQKNLADEWLKYKLNYKLDFLESEEAIRKEIFSKNNAFIMKSNAKNTTFTLKMNNFGHLEKHERSKLHMLPRGKRLYGDASSIFFGKKIPCEYDWRKAGVVSPVKNQLHCGSWYAFSTVGAIESQFAIHTGVLPNLSEQEIVDCSWKYWNYGCYGGFPQSVYKYCIRNGLSTSDAYPYRGRNSKCNRNNPNSSYKLVGYKDLKKGDEENLLRAIYRVGPISIAIDASPEEYDFYDSGILDLPFCSSENLTHAVLAVGYSLSKIPYLLVKNSWGKNWGMDGYFKIRLYRNNMCGISSYASYPIPKIE
ncbi:hypothetical protein MXB_3552 [Myxobolus squamalis]|nr:hypothetical protein MXB_3552 [Myxobolus squamalis]